MTYHHGSKNYYMLPKFMKYALYTDMLIKTRITSSSRMEVDALCIHQLLITMCVPSKSGLTSGIKGNTINPLYTKV